MTKNNTPTPQEINQFKTRDEIRDFLYIHCGLDTDDILSVMSSIRTVDEIETAISKARQEERERVLGEIKEAGEYFDYWEGEYPEPDYVIETVLNTLTKSDE